MLDWFGKRLRELHEKNRDERGFMLIELLVVVIIIGILAGIAIPAFLGQRERAQVATVKSDVRNAATVNTALAASGTAAGITAGTYAAGATVGTAGQNSFAVSNGVSLSVTGTTATNKVIVGTAVGGPSGNFTYTASTGAFSATGTDFGGS